MKKSINQVKKIITLLFVVLICTGCPDKCEGCHQYITMVNKSDKTVVWQPRLLRINETEKQYNCEYVLGGSIQSNTSYKFNYDDGGNVWEAALNTHLLQIIVMDSEIFESYVSAPCDTIHKYVPILDTYRLTLADLQRMNWTVVFPPEEQIH